MISTLRSIFETRLKEAGNSITDQRVALFELLSKHDAPMTLREITDRLAETVDRTSIYRAIELFEKLGIVQRIQIGWKYKIELSALFSHHHHHATCIKCGQMSTFEESQDLETRIHILAKSIGLTLESHSLELRGICDKCQSSEGAKED